MTFGKIAVVLLVVLIVLLCSLLAFVAIRRRRRGSEEFADQYEDEIEEEEEDEGKEESETVVRGFSFVDEAPVFREDSEEDVEEAGGEEPTPAEPEPILEPEPIPEPIPVVAEDEKPQVLDGIVEPTESEVFDGEIPMVPVPRYHNVRSLVQIVNMNPRHTIEILNKRAVVYPHLLFDMETGKRLDECKNG